MDVTSLESVSRARSACGRGIHYALGAGGMHPEDPLPSRNGLCDCSGFIAWALGRNRHDPEMPGGWIETSAIVRDALAMKGEGLFDALKWGDAQPGDLVVYGDRYEPGTRRLIHQGHVGIIASVGATGPETAVHCSKGNDRRSGDAIQETGVELWETRGGIVARHALPAETGDAA